MLWVNLPVVNTIHPKSTKFVTGVKVKSTVESKFNDSLGTPPGWDASPSQGYPLNSVELIGIWGERGTMRVVITLLIIMKSVLPKNITQYLTSSTAKTWTVWSKSTAQLSLGQWASHDNYDTCDTLLCCNHSILFCLEHHKNVLSDSWRLNQLDKSSVNPSHPYSKFGSGKLCIFYTTRSCILVKMNFMKMH